jgi:quinol monooxygenase YgiN
MSAIAKFVKLTTSPEQLPALRKVLVDLAIETRKEEGCILYDIYDNGEGTCRVVELWRDAAAADAHVPLPHTASAVAAFGPMLTEEPEVDDYYPANVAAMGG